jgi:AcrR family transcriptional regulator
VTKPDRPRTRDAARTRSAILAAGKAAFSERGYAQTGIRDIAAMAGVSSSLIDRYFGSKGKLFEAALLEAMLERQLFDEGKAGFGKRLAERLAEPDLDIQLLAMSVLSVADDEARDITAHITRDHIIEPMAEWLGPPNARERATKILMVGTGFTIYTRQLPVSGLPRVPQEMYDWLADTVQSIVDAAD